MDNFQEMDFSAEFWDTAIELPHITLDMIKKIMGEVEGIRLSTSKKEFLVLKNLTALSNKIELEKNPPETIDPELEKKHLLNIKHDQSDFFIAEIEDLPYFKNDVASMAHPIFALKSGDTRTIEYESKTNLGQLQKVIIRPSAELGRATIFDKDIWIFIISKLMHAKFNDKPTNKTVEFSSLEFFLKTNRGRGGNQYDLLRNSLNRLVGTRIETNITTGSKRIAEGFGLLDSWKITEEGKNQAPLKILVTLPDWLYNSIEAKEVLQITGDYFRLRKALDRRIYEIARKHCGHQKSWRIKLLTLKQKTGTVSTDRHFRHSIKSLAEANVLPGYEVKYEAKEDMITFENREKASSDT